MAESDQHNSNLDSDSSLYYFDDDGRMYRRDPDGTMYYYQEDGNNDPEGTIYYYEEITDDAVIVNNEISVITDDSRDLICSESRMVRPSTSRQDCPVDLNQDNLLSGGGIYPPLDPVVGVGLTRRERDRIAAARRRANESEEAREIRFEKNRLASAAWRERQRNQMHENDQNSNSVVRINQPAVRTLARISEDPIRSESCMVRPSTSRQDCPLDSDHCQNLDNLLVADIQQLSLDDRQNQQVSEPLSANIHQGSGDENDPTEGRGLIRVERHRIRVENERLRQAALRSRDRNLMHGMGLNYDHSFDYESYKHVNRGDSF